MRSFRDGVSKPTTIKTVEKPLSRSFNDGFIRPIPTIRIWTPKNVDNLSCWFDANKILGLSDGDSVSLWEDLSDNGYDLTQSTPSLQPTFKTKIVNGKNVVRFSSDDMTNASISLTQPFTVLFVWSISSGTGNQYSFSSLGAVNCGIYRRDSGGSYQVALYAGGLLNAYIGGASFSHTITTGVFNSATSKVYKNGSLEITGNGGTVNINGIRLGASSGGSLDLNGDIAEFILYDSVVPDSDLDKLHQYLSKKYAITLAA